MKNILVTGGLGYIGSHTVVELAKQGYNVVIVDNLVNSKISVLPKLELITGVKLEFYKYDVTDEVSMEKVFEKYNFYAVIHFAGLKSVGESVSKPLEYYENNVLSTIVTAKMCATYKVKHLVFSSSATVYGNNISPLEESMTLQKTTNPYGETKVMSERILTDLALSNNAIKITLLRYFNPVGAHESGLIGEDPNNIPNNIMPYITKVAKGTLEELSIFGNDYPTYDGTGIRDYIHVVDLAKGHISALNQKEDGIKVYNLGTGKGTSVLELVNTFISVNQINVPFKFTNRRPGDLAVAYADSSKAYRELGWKTSYTIEDMVRDAWNFEKNN
jgi:UDP-glucose 4-epimerase